MGISKKIISTNFNVKYKFVGATTKSTKTCLYGADNRLVLVVGENVIRGSVLFLLRLVWDYPAYVELKIEK